MAFISSRLLKRAVLDEDLKTLKRFLSSGANPNIVCDEYGTTLLHIVRSSELAEELIKFNADIEAKDAFGRTPLCCAVTYSNRLKVIEVLLSNGANANVRMKLGTTPLHMAPNVESTKILLSGNADVNIVDRVGRAPIHSALIDGKGLDVIKALIEAGADVNLKMSKFRHTLLHLSDSLEVTRELILHGADVNAENAYGHTPLHSAIRYVKDAAIVRELLKGGAHVNFQSVDGETALGIAMKGPNKNFSAVKELLKYGASLNFELYNYFIFGYRTRSVLESVLFSDMPCAKLILRMYLLRNWKETTTLPIDLSRQSHYRNGKELFKYKDDCISEIIQMKCDKMFLKYTLYDLFYRTEDCVKPIYGHYEEIFNDLKNKYPIYHGDIMEEVEKGLERGRLLTRLEQFYTRLHFSNDIKQEIRLNSDCLLIIANYLSDSDILNVIIALEEYFYPSN